MRILLAQNSLYYPAHGGGDKSNRLLLEALAARGHECRAVARISSFGTLEQQQYRAELDARGVVYEAAAGVVHFTRLGVDVRVVTSANLRAYCAAQSREFQPDIILASTDDPTQALLEEAIAAPSARVVYLARATLALPFGPDCAFPSESKTARIHACARVVGVSQYVADYCRRHAGLDAVHVPISLMEPEVWPDQGRFDNQLVVMTNPCAVKGIDIFLALADQFPETAFAAVTGWGTNARDRAALQARPNVRLLEPVDEIDLLFARTRVLLVPSLWAEARSRIVMEAMLRGVPVLAADVGGIPEAKLGVPYLLPVNRIKNYRPDVDEQMVPVAEVPPQEIGPWREALRRLLGDRAHYEEIAAASRHAALAYARTLTVEPLERLLETCLDETEPESPESSAPGPSLALPNGRGSETGSGAAATLAALSPEKRELLGLRLRRRANASSWFPGIDRTPAPRLFWFPHAGGGTLAGLTLDVPHIPVRLPGRESRLLETPFERMQPLVAALAAALEPYAAAPFAFFGHSMGAVVAFELARTLRRRGLPLPHILIASSARAPQFRRGHVPPPPASDRELLEQLDIAPELAAAVLPALRADTNLYSHYSYRDEPPLECPIRAYGGSTDSHILRVHLEGWREETAASFAVRLFSGGHFYWRDSGAEFRQALEADLE
ncbi:MAG TPA: thioesterase domain-containing protein [Bryobacteraceae bacterium]|nr:thioesterase domain-containing protein [Bryobacteraceae bacterium]